MFPPFSDSHIPSLNPNPAQPPSPAQSAPPQHPRNQRQAPIAKLDLFETCKKSYQIYRMGLHSAQSSHHAAARHRPLEVLTASQLGGSSLLWWALGLARCPWVPVSLILDPLLRMAHWLHRTLPLRKSAQAELWYLGAAPQSMTECRRMRPLAWTWNTLR